MIETNGWLTPDENWSKLPHQFFEFLPEFNTTSEAIVILYILRHTWGYQEYGEDDFKVITIDEFMHGRKRKDGTRIDRGTGLTKNTIKKALAAAELDNLICVRTDDRDKARIEKAYRLNMWGSKNDPPRSEIDPHQSKTDPRTEKDTIERNKRNSPTPPSGESDSANSVNGKKPKTGRSKEDLDALYNMICKGSFNKDHSEIDKPQRGRVLAIRKALLKAIPDVTAEELKQAYVLYAQKNPEALEDVTRRLKSETKVPDWLQMAIDEGMVPTRQVIADPRASQKWQANAEIYRAYADAFSDRWSDAEILAQDFSGIEAWWFHTGQYGEDE